MKKLLYTFLVTIVSVSLFAQTKVSAPVQVAPEDNSINQMPDVLLDWNPVAGVGQVSYEAQLADDDTFTNPVIFDVIVTSVSTENLLFGKTYFWRVRATDDLGTSDWSSTFKFTIFNSLDLNKPDDGSEGEPPDAELGWKNKVGGNAGTPISGFTYVDCQIDTSYFWKVDNQVPVSNDLKSIYFLDENNGFAVGAGGTIIHNDGTAWSEETSPVTTDLNAVSIFADGSAIAVGKSGTVLGYDSGVWDILPDVPNEEDFNDVSVLSDGTGWIVGTGDSIIYFNDEGPVLQYNPSGKDLNGVYAISADNVWAVGKSGKIIQFNGSEWSEVASPTSKTLADVFFTDASNGWAVGKSGKILHYDGTDWTEVESSVNFDLESVYMLNSNYGWAAGKDGGIASYDGNTWSPTASGTTNKLYSAFMLDEDNIWFAGDEGTIVFWTGNGFSSPVAFIRTTTIDSTEVAMDQLLFNTKYYWRVRARHDLDTSSWSAVRTFTTIDKVILSEPANNSTDMMLDVQLKWQAISGTFSYIYEVCRNPDFSIPCTSFSEDNQVNAQGLRYDSTYYWRVKAAHTKDTTDWSDVWSFTTINTVFLVSPNNGDTTSALPVFEWDSLTATDGYVVEYDLSDGFENAEPEIVDAPNTKFNVVYPLDKGKTYYWRVKAFHDGDTTGWSETRYFITEPEIGIESVIADNGINIFPNPAKDKLNISIQTPDKMEINFKILNLLGDEIISDRFTFEQGANIRKVDISKIDNGVYILQLSSEGNIFSRKLIIDK